MKSPEQKSREEQESSWHSVERNRGVSLVSYQGKDEPEAFSVIINQQSKDRIFLVYFHDGTKPETKSLSQPIEDARDYLPFWFGVMYVDGTQYPVLSQAVRKKTSYPEIQFVHNGLRVHTYPPKNPFDMEPKAEHFADYLNRLHTTLFRGEWGLADIEPEPLYIPARHHRPAGP